MSPIDLPSSTDATPTPPEAPVTSRVDPAGGGAGGSLHCVSACHAVRNVSGAPAISSNDQPSGIFAKLAAQTTVFSASVPQVSTPTSQRRMPTVSPTATFETPAPTANTSPTPSRPRTCGSGGLAGYWPKCQKGVGRIQGGETHAQERLARARLRIGNFGQAEFFDALVAIHQPCAHEGILAKGEPTAACNLKTNIELRLSDWRYNSGRGKCSSCAFISAISVALLFASALFGQNRFGTPVLTGGFGNAVFPGRYAMQTFRAITRFTPNAVFPAGGGPRLVIPGQRPTRLHRNGQGSQCRMRIRSMWAAADTITRTGSLRFSSNHSSSRI